MTRRAIHPRPPVAGDDLIRPADLMRSAGVGVLIVLAAALLAGLAGAWLAWGLS